MRVLVSGATGFLGGYLVRELLACGHQVVAMVRTSSDTNGLEGIELRHGDLSDPGSLVGVCAGVDAVAHLAAYYTFTGDWDRYQQINVDGTRHLVEDAKRCGARFIYCSSTEAMGPINGPPADESTPEAPALDYGRSKLMAERVVRASGAHWTIMRPSGIYGPGNVDDISYWFIKALAGPVASRFIIGDGSTKIQFVHVMDVVQGIVLALENPYDGETFIITEEGCHTYEEVYAILTDILGRRMPRLHVPIWLAKVLVAPVDGINRLIGRENFIWRVSSMDSFIQDRTYSIDRARRLLGYRPRYDLSTGLAETVAWYGKQGLI